MEKQKLNTTVIYILSILGFLCCCLGGLGLIPSGIAYFMAKSKMKEATVNPDVFENGQAMNTAKTIALVVLIINVLYFMWSLYGIYAAGGFEAWWQEAMSRAEQFQS